ncbi:hypothetical protein HELRODRAFT_178977 [Helobdella robusta]|uniref:C-type lectin domain-containing protein n=1 Tax=Helobdella robusta TaxID=6412 RepID=T1FDZ9_HELRO|nr:hypothetical protein HELRODRAFT_178977 [Helobdella robusta]ESN95794.1 hypothetical protein HELRODRAFT_178977 [Helobdella robusta]
MVFIYKEISRVDRRETVRYWSSAPRSNKNVLCSAKGNWPRGKSCYFPIKIRFPWYKGHYECAKLGGGLAVLDELNADDIDQMWTQLDLQNETYWIGLTMTLLWWKKKRLENLHQNLCPKNVFFVF